MKARKFQKALVVAIAGLVLLAVNAPAQHSNNTTAAPQLTPNVAEIMELAQAKVSNDTILAYIRGARKNYSLNAAQIIYLHQLGIADALITAMLNKTEQGSSTTTVPMPTTPAPEPVASPAYAQPPETDVESEPTTDYNDEPYYYQYPVYSYYYWPGPVVLSYGWGGYWHGGQRGGWHGGAWHRGGVVRGGGFVHNSGFAHGGGQAGVRR
jgi:hypothetical protein